MKYYSELVSELLKHEVGEVIASPVLIMQLLSVYSVLYLNGANPGTCGKCHKDYFYKLKSNGMERAKEYDEAKNRTCQPKWKGLKFINKPVCRHFNNELITDAQAISLLDAGFLKPEDFIKLPENWNDQLGRVIEAEAVAAMEQVPTEPVAPKTAKQVRKRKK